MAVRPVLSLPDPVLKHAAAPVGRIDDAASVYSVNGKQYVLIASGGSSLIGAGTGGFIAPSPATFTAFALG